MRKSAAVNKKRETIVVGIDDKITSVGNLKRNPVPCICSGTSVVKSTPVLPANDISNQSQLEMLSEIWKTLASPTRIRILGFLNNNEKTVTQLTASLGTSRPTSKANISQHLVVMRHRGVLAARRDGTKMFYRVANQKIVNVCLLMREILKDQQAE